MRHGWFVGAALALSLVVAPLAAERASAAVVAVNPTADSSTVDVSFNGSFTGSPFLSSPNHALLAVLFAPPVPNLQSGQEQRAGMEFSLAGVPDGATLLSASLSVAVTNYSNPLGGAIPLDLFGYAGNGAIALGDFYAGTLAAGPFGVGGVGSVAQDVTGFVAGLLAADAPFAGFILRMNPAYVAARQGLGGAGTSSLNIGSADNANAALRPVLTLEFAVPAPAALPLLALGLAGLIALRRRG